MDRLLVETQDFLESHFVDDQRPANRTARFPKRRITS
jgi:hypothetical protein